MQYVARSRDLPRAGGEKLPSPAPPQKSSPSQNAQRERGLRAGLVASAKSRAWAAAEKVVLGAGPVQQEGTEAAYAASADRRAFASPRWIPAEF